MLARQVRDEHPRVRLEAIRGLSFFPTMEAVDAALAALESPLDSWLTTRWSTRSGALEPVWSEAYDGRQAGGGQSATAQEFVANYVARRQPGLAAQQHLKTLLNPEAATERREHGYAAHRKARRRPPTTAGPCFAACAPAATRSATAATTSAPT